MIAGVCRVVIIVDVTNYPGYLATTQPNPVEEGGDGEAGTGTAEEAQEELERTTCDSRMTS